MKYLLDQCEFEEMKKQLAKADKLDPAMEAIEYLKKHIKPELISPNGGCDHSGYGYCDDCVFGPLLGDMSHDALKMLCDKYQNYSK